MNRHADTHTVVGWIDIRPTAAASSRWALGGDDFTRDLERLTGKDTAAASAERLATLATAPSRDGFAEEDDFFGDSVEYSSARCSGRDERGRVPADLAALSRELDARLAQVQSRLVTA